MSGNDLTTVELMAFRIRVHSLGYSPGCLLLLDPETEDEVYFVVRVYSFCIIIEL